MVSICEGDGVDCAKDVILIVFSFVPFCIIAIGGTFCLSCTFCVSVCEKVRIIWKKMKSKKKKEKLKPEDEILSSCGMSERSIGRLSDIESDEGLLDDSDYEELLEEDDEEESYDDDEEEEKETTEIQNRFQTRILGEIPREEEIVIEE